MWVSSLSPGVPEELLEELRNLLPSKSAAGGLCFLVLSQTLSFSKREPHHTHLSLVLFIPNRHLSQTGSSRTSVREEMGEWKCLTSSWYKDLKAQVNGRLRVFVVIVSSSLLGRRKCSMQQQVKATRTSLSPRDTKYHKMPGARKGDLGKD